jgi:carboxymethylenebutenolidase
MKARALVMTLALVVLLAGGRLVLGQRRADIAIANEASAAGRSAAVASMTLRTALPSEKTAKAVLNSTSRHPEWVSVPAGSENIQTFVVYPERPVNAPVVLVTSNNQGLSDWMRAVATSRGAGFIAVVPDLLSGLGPHGGNTDSFVDRQAIVQAFDRMDGAERLRRTRAIREYAFSLPSGNGKNVTLGLNSDADGHARIDAEADSARASFELTEQSWPKLMSFLTQATGNRFTPSQELVDLHAGLHGSHMMAQEPGRGGGGAAARREDLPPPYNRAKLIVARSPRKGGWVDIPMGTSKLHTWIVYPQTPGKTGVVLVMQPGPSLDEWLLGVGDQLAYHGFIAVVPDLCQVGSTGGNTDTFEFRRHKPRTAATDSGRDHESLPDGAGLRGPLPQANGKSGSIGFCAGGGDSWRFAAESPVVNAAVSFYGAPPVKDTMSRIHAPVIAFFGENDLGLAPRIAPGTAMMKELGKPFEVHVYEKATHAFLNRQDLGENMKATGRKRSHFSAR